MWQWWNCAAEHAPAGLELLRINLDETAVCLFQGGGKGTVICRKRRLSGELVQRVKAGAKRTYLTHIALVCDRPELQPLLPQVVIGNEATFRAGDLQTYQAACPRNVHLLRQQSAWSNIRVCLRVIQLLGAALRAVQHPPLVRRWQPVLVMDACRLHLHRSVAEACWRQGVCLVIVPAKMTWLLQPLDTHAFRLYKQHLREEWQRARQQTLDGDVTVRQCLGALCSTIRHVLQGHEWARAFDEDGFGQGQRLVTARILQRLDLDSPPNPPAALPSMELLRLCFPRRSAVPASTLLRPYRPAPSAAPARAQHPAQGGAQRLPVGRRLSLRPVVAVAPPASAGPVTRSQSRLVAALGRGRPLPPPTARPLLPGRRGA